MLHIKTTINQSPIHGTGVFAAENVAKGTMTWSYVEGFDRIITEREYESLPDEAKDFLQTYSYQCKSNRNYYLTVDNDRFTNHSETPNVGLAQDGRAYALRDIAEGEEITMDYRSFELLSRCRQRLAA